MKKYRCNVCGYIHEGDAPPATCPTCGADASKFEEMAAGCGIDLVEENVLGVAQGSGFEDDLRAQFNGECSEVGMYLAMGRVAERQGYAEVAETYKRIAWEEAGHAARFGELLGEVLTSDTKKNLEMRVAAECGANKGKKDIAKRSKEANQDEIHDAIHEACRDEARHAMAFYGLLNRYFK